MKSNVERGTSFSKAARSILERHLTLVFEAEVPLPVGDPPKLHKFDLASAQREWVLECKNLAWRANGGIPQAKITSITEAAGFLRGLALESSKAVVLNRASHASRRETLAEYYARLHRHSLGTIGLAEIDLEKKTVHWLVRPQALATLTSTSGNQIDSGPSRPTDLSAPDGPRRLASPSSESTIDIHDLYGHIARFCEALWKGRQEAPMPRDLAALISALQRQNLVPSLEASMMHSVRTVRNSHVHDHRRLGPQEIQAVKAAWEVITKWAERQHAGLWKASEGLP